MAFTYGQVAGLYAGNFKTSTVTSADLAKWIDYREKDANGKNAATTLDDLAEAMFQDANAYATISTTAEFLNEVYQAVFGRDIDTDATKTDATAESGLTFWTAKMDGGMSKSAVISAIVANAQGTDVTAAAALATTVKDYLTDGVDNLSGTTGNDTYIANVIDNANSLENGDMINGGAGTDTLNVTLADSTMAVLVQTTSVENVAFRAQENATDASDNNMVANESQIDAELMVGTTRYESYESRSDLVIEDVRIEDTEITKDITVAMVSTDAGDVDFGVYFDQHSLRAAAADTSGAVLNLELMDTRNGDLTENPYNGFKFSITVDGVAKEYTIQDIDATTGLPITTGPINTATTYAQLLTAVQNAVTAQSALSDITVSISGTFTAIDTDSGTAKTGQIITLTNGGAGTMSIGSWLTADGSTPASSGLHTQQDTVVPATSGNLITSEIILDDVGSGSNGGDLVVGGMSTGLSSDSKGVEQFNITVERSSSLESIASTNNTLEEVYFVNGTTKGNVSVGNGTKEAADSQGDLDGDAAQDNTGLTDVRVVDASAMTGSVTINADLTSNVTAKYMDSKDTASDGATDNDYVNDGHIYGTKGFVYTLGTANDTLTLDISEANLAAAGSTTREDFSLAINGMAGNDTITTTINTGAISDTDNWYTNSKDNANLAIDAGAGNDTVTTSGAGDFIITTGTGNDTVYTDNVGTVDYDTDGDAVVDNASKAAWVVNAGADVAVFAADNAEDISDLDGTALTEYFLYKSTVQVTYTGAIGTGNGVAVANTLGFESASTTITTDYTGTQQDVNQAIKKAINEDSVLSKLLVATDGPANTLVITSLIDGTFAASDLSFDIAGFNYDGLTVGSSEHTLVDTAYNDFIKDSTTAPTTALLTAQITALTAADTSYTTPNMAEDSLGTEIVGAISTSTSDNTINLGSGDDVLVLGTDVQSNDKIVFTGTDIGNNTVVNFVDSTASAVFNDSLDFTSYFTNVVSASASTESQTDAATLASTATVAVGVNLNSSDVGIVTGFTATATETWAGLTETTLLASIKDDADLTNDHANLVAATADVLAAEAGLVGTTQQSILMVENDANNGEYKVFELTSSATEFTAATLLGTVDFGATLSVVTADFA